MIHLTRLNSAAMVLNSDLIEHIDVTPDTVITLTTGQILRVRESAEEVVQRIVEFRKRIFHPKAPIREQNSTYVPQFLSRDSRFPIPEFCSPCSRAFCVNTVASNQDRLNSGHAAWSRNASISASRLSSS